VSAGVAYVTGAVSAGVSTVLAVFGFLSSLPGRIAGFFGSARTAAVEKMVSLVSWLRGLPGRVLAAVGDLGSVLLNAGKAIIKGLIRGVTSMIGSLKDKLGSITDMIPDLKGPMDVDLKLLTPSGSALMTGLMSGIDDEVPALERQLAGVTSSIPGNVNASVTTAAASAADSRELTVRFIGSEDEFNQFMRRSVAINGGGSVQRAYGQGA
jgi:hypothetical protein